MSVRVTMCSRCEGGATEALELVGRLASAAQMIRGIWDRSGSGCYTFYIIPQLLVHKMEDVRLKPT